MKAYGSFQVEASRASREGLGSQVRRGALSPLLAPGNTKREAAPETQLQGTELGREDRKERGGGRHEDKGDRRRSGETVDLRPPSKADSSFRHL